MITYQFLYFTRINKLITEVFFAGCNLSQELLFKVLLMNYSFSVAGGAIPDAAAIHAARKKREAARAAGEKEDFIPIKDVEKETKSKRGPRLLREEDEDDEEERISFTVKENKREDEYHKKIGRGREEEESDSDPEWEKMQISKAINNQQVGSAQVSLEIFLFFI